MTFLNFALAFGAISAAIPIAIHLLNRRRFDVVQWGAMHLLEPVVRTNRKRIRLEQLLLLLVRMAILALLALCMAGPVLTGWHALSGNARTSLTVLFDNSYSMEAGVNGSSNMEVARRNTAQLIEHQRRGSDLSLVMMAGGSVTGSTSPTTNLARSANDIRELRDRFGNASVSDSIETAVQSINTMQHAKRDLVIVSDFQAIDWSGDAAPELLRALELIDAMPLRPTITLMQVGREIHENVSVQSIDLSPSVVAAGQSLQIRANIRNHGDVPYPALRVNLRVDGADKLSSELRLGAGEDGQVVFQHTFESAGSHVVDVEAEADTLVADNHASAAIDVWDRIPVLLVDGDPSNEPLQSETDFMHLALSPFMKSARATADDDASLLRVDLIEATQVRTPDLTADRLNRCRVLVLANIARLTDAQLTAVKNFVNEGNSLLVFPGERIDTRWYRERMGDSNDGLLRTAFSELRSSALRSQPARAQPLVRQVAFVPQLVAMVPDNSATTVRDEFYEHPALALFNDARNGRLSEASIGTWYRLTPETGVTLARLNNGDPLFMEHSHGDGRVIVCATTCDDAWTNLPARPVYVPLMQRLITYLATAVEPNRNVKTGETIVAQFPNGSADISLQTPTNESVDLVTVAPSSKLLVEHADTSRPGVYTVTRGDGEKLHYTATPDRDESELLRLNDDELDTLAKTLDASVVHSTDEFIELDSRRRYGREIWRPLYWLMLAFVFGEVLLQHIFSGVRLPRIPFAAFAGGRRP